MGLLVRATLALRRLVRQGRGVVIALVLALYVIAGGATAPVGFQLVSAVILWAGSLYHRLRTKLSEPGEAPLLVDFEIGALLAVGLDGALLRFEGGLSGRFSPAVYVLVAIVAAYARPVAGFLVVGFVVVLEAAIRAYQLGDTSFESFRTHAAFVTAFALLNYGFLRAEIARIRVTAQSRIEEELRAMREDARSYRLLGAGDADNQDERSRERLERSSVEEIHESVHYALDLLRRTLHLHTAVLLWLNDSGTHLKISELSTHSEDINDAPISAGDGVLGAVVARKTRVNLHSLKPSYKIPYYRGDCPIRVFAAIPVFEERSLRGILAIDRRENVPFTPEDEETAVLAARFCLRAIQNERTFVQLERAKVEQGKLYRAAQALSSALSEKDVLEEAVRAAQEVASFDYAAVTIYDETTRTHEVCAVKSTSGELDEFVGAKFAHNSGLVAMVVQNRYPLPYRGEYDASHHSVLSRKLAWPKVPSLLVLPLLLHERALGTLILGARRRHAFGDSVRPTLEVLATHLAVSLSNARLIHKLETMATTDGMTGLLNKRAMLESATQKITAAARFGRPLSLLVTDIDFFKKVNDTYGHDVGDVVIRGLGDILKKQKRATDIVARFGGEEFVVLCEQTDEKGAFLLAERIREDLARATFRSPNGTLQVTCSIGIATFPAAGNDWETLFKAADEALYISKRSGRNRSTTYVERRSERPRTSTASPGVPPFPAE